MDHSCLLMMAFFNHGEHKDAQRRDSLCRCGFISNYVTAASAKKG